VWSGKCEDLVAAEAPTDLSCVSDKSDEWKQTYLVKEYYERYMMNWGISIHAEFYTAMGTVLARKVFALLLAYKVIAVDCDHTLWTGICAEDGASELHDPAHRHCSVFTRPEEAASCFVCAAEQ